MRRLHRRQEVGLRNFIGAYLMTDMEKPLVLVMAVFCTVALVQMSRVGALLAEEENALSVLRESFGNLDWEGDPCVSASWIECSGDSVTSLRLARRNLTGSIPQEISVFRQLTFLSLSLNGLSGPIPDLQNLTKLTDVALDGNRLTGGIPSTLFQLGNLERLNLSINPLGGAIPEVTNLTKIVVLDLTQTELTGTLPDSISSLSNLVTLYIGGNPLLEGSMSVMNRILSLKEFNASKCGFSGDLPTMQFSAGLEVLDLHQNNFSGKISAALLNHDSLVLLNLNDIPALSGPLEDLTLLDKISSLFIRNAGLTGVFPAEGLTKNPNLQFLDLANNKLTTFPTDLENLKTLQRIDVQNNAINGPLPDLPSGSVQTFTTSLKWLIFSQNRFRGGIPDSWAQLTYLQVLSLNSNNLSGVIENELGGLTNLKQLNLSFNNFSGKVPENLGNLKQLETLDLSNNGFSGDIPESLALLTSLRILKLDNNKLSGIPGALMNLSRLTVTYNNNPGIQIIYGSKAGSSTLATGAIVGLVVGVCVIVGLLILVAVLLFRARRKSYGPIVIADMPKSATRFTPKQIKTMTSNYKTMIGKGGFGPVYHGVLPDGKEVAVKVRASDSKQGVEEFINEVRLLSKLHHRNLVGLVGYGLQRDQQFLIYDFMSQGTVYDHLYRQGGTSNVQALDWKMRLNIAINTARGIEYLHKDCNPPVIHRDVKSSNILLTSRLEGKLGDLGISKQAPEVDSDKSKFSGVSTLIKGTFGYLDPEYFTRRRLTTKSDVYSFGVVLLELITGKKPQTFKFPDSNSTNLIDWVQDGANKEQIEHLIDRTLQGDYDPEGMMRVVRLALSCVDGTGSLRPDMGEVARTLTHVLHLEGGEPSSIQSRPREISPLSMEDWPLETAPASTSAPSTVYQNLSWSETAR